MILFSITFQLQAKKTSMDMIKVQAAMEELRKAQAEIAKLQQIRTDAELNVQQAKASVEKSQR